MFYVQRDSEGCIQSVQKESDKDHGEWLSIDHPDMIDFFNERNSPEKKLLASDLEMSRAIEDLIEVLVKKHVINFTDLPEATQNKILKRKEIRNMLREVL